MRLYHGSKRQYTILKPNQATAPADSEQAKLIPEKELMNAVYLTLDFQFALAMAARPPGLTKIDNDNGKKSITFENPKLFNPDQPMYIHEVDAAAILKEFWKKEKYVAIHAQSVKFRIIKYSILIPLFICSYYWKGTRFTGILLLTLTVVAVTMHFILRWKTKAWSQNWGTI